MTTGEPRAGPGGWGGRSEERPRCGASLFQLIPMARRPLTNCGERPPPPAPSLPSGWLFSIRQRPGVQVQGQQGTGPWAAGRHAGLPLAWERRWRGTPVLAQRVHLWDGLLLEEGLKPGFWAAGHLQPKVAGRAGLRVAHNWCPRAWAVLPAQSCGRATPRHSTWTSARQCHCGPV